MGVSVFFNVKHMIISAFIFTAAVGIAGDNIVVDLKPTGNNQAIRLLVYNEKLYKTAYSTFIGAGDLRDAFSVAYAAVKQLPENLYWREKLYQVARWRGFDDVAMEQLLFLVMKTKNIRYVNFGIEMAEQLGDPEILRNLLKIKANISPLTSNDSLKLAASHENMGDPERAVIYLKKQWKKNKKIVYLRRLADVYARMGAIKLESDVLSSLRKYDSKSPAAAVREAQVYYSRNKLSVAFDILESVKRYAKPTDTKYWELYADVAWQLQKMDQALRAYKILDKSNRLSDLAMRRYITLVGRYNVHQALDLTVAAWKEYKQPVFLIWFVEYSLKVQDWHAFGQLYQRFGGTAKNLLENMSSYQTASIQALLSQKKYRKAHVAYLKAIQKEPSNADLKLSYLWFLIDRKHRLELRQRLFQWQSLKYSNDNFTLAFAVGYRILGEKRQALWLLYQGLPAHMNDVVYLTNYLDQLMEVRSSDGEPSEPEQAMRRYIWALIQVQAKQEKSWQSDTFAINYAKVARILSPGQPTLQIMSHLSQFKSKPEAVDAVLAWALANRYYAAANQVYRQSRINHIIVAPWIQLTLALHSYDKDWMHRLLTKQVKNLPVRDRTVAAHKIGEEAQAEQLAYAGLNKYPKNQKTYELFRQIMLPRADFWDIDSEHVTTQLLMLQKYETYGRYFVTPTVALLPYFDIRDQHARNPIFITNVPNNDIESGLRVHKITPRGYVDGSLGARDAMKTFTTSDWRWFYRLTEKWTMLWDLGIHQVAEESDYMTVGAMQNRLGVLLVDNVTVRDELALQATQHYFYGQDSESVSNGQVYRASYTRRMWLQYPDYFFRLFGSVNEFHNVSAVTGILNTLVPPGQQAVNSGQQLLPESFIQYGLSVGVGERYREEYTHGWKPFAIASVFRNNNSAKIGTLFDGGIAGAVFGRDHLAIFASHTEGVEGNNNTRFVLGLDYRIYF